MYSGAMQTTRLIGDLMKIIKMLKNPKYAASTVAFAVFMFFFLPFVQTLGLNTDLWYEVIPPLNFILFITFDIVFGLFVSFQIYQYMGPKECRINKKSAAGGFLGTALSFIVGICPVCFGFASVLLPLGVVATLVVFGPVFIILSILLMLFSIHSNDGFKRG